MIEPQWLHRAQSIINAWFSQRGPHSQRQLQFGRQRECQFQLESRQSQSEHGCAFRGSVLFFMSLMIFSSLRAFCRSQEVIAQDEYIFCYRLV